MSTTPITQVSETTLLSLDELARRWGVSKRWVQTRVSSGEIPSVKLAGGPKAPRRVRECDAATYLAERVEVGSS